MGIVGVGVLCTPVPFPHFRPLASSSIISYNPPAALKKGSYGL